MYAYTFASPATTLNAQAHDARYANIFNIANPSDIMPYLPLRTWGYERYGIDKALPALMQRDSMSSAPRWSACMSNRLEWRAAPTRPTNTCRCGADRRRAGYRVG